MQGPLAHMVALTCHANARLRGMPTTPFRERSVEQFCERVEFLSPKQGDWVTVARTSDEWLGAGGQGYLVTCAARRVLLRWSDGGRSQPAGSAGMVGGGATGTFLAAGSLDIAIGVEGVDFVTRQTKRISEIATAAAAITANTPSLVRGGGTEGAGKTV